MAKPAHTISATAAKRAMAPMPINTFRVRELIRDLPPEPHIYSRQMPGANGDRGRGVMPSFPSASLLIEDSMRSGRFTGELLSRLAAVAEPSSSP